MADIYINTIRKGSPYYSEPILLINEQTVSLTGVGLENSERAEWHSKITRVSKLRQVRHLFEMHVASQENQVVLNHQSRDPQVVGGNRRGLLDPRDPESEWLRRRQDLPPKNRS